jgi:hypothetical protein
MIGDGDGDDCGAVSGMNDRQENQGTGIKPA